MNIENLIETGHITREMTAGMSRQDKCAELLPSQQANLTNKHVISLIGKGFDKITIQKAMNLNEYQLNYLNSDIFKGIVGADDTKLSLDEIINLSEREILSINEIYSMIGDDFFTMPIKRAIRLSKSECIEYLYRVNLENVKIRRLIDNGILTEEVAKSLTFNQRKNLESDIICSMIGRGANLLTITSAKNLTSHEKIKIESCHNFIGVGANKIHLPYLLDNKNDYVFHFLKYFDRWIGERENQIMVDKFIYLDIRKNNGLFRDQAKTSRLAELVERNILSIEDILSLDPFSRKFAILTNAGIHELIINRLLTIDEAANLTNREFTILSNDNVRYFLLYSPYKISLQQAKTINDSQLYMLSNSAVCEAIIEKKATLSEVMSLRLSERVVVNKNTFDFILYNWHLSRALRAKVMASEAINELIKNKKLTQSQAIELTEYGLSALSNPLFRDLIYAGKARINDLFKLRVDQLDILQQKHNIKLILKGCLSVREAIEQNLMQNRFFFNSSFFSLIENNKISFKKAVKLSKLNSTATQTLLDKNVCELITTNILKVIQALKFTPDNIEMLQNQNIMRLITSKKLSINTFMLLNQNQFTILSSDIICNLIVNSKLSIDDAKNITPEQFIKLNNVAIEQLILSGKLTMPEIFDLNEAELSIITKDNIFALITDDKLEPNTAITLSEDTLNIIDIPEITALLHAGKLNIESAILLTEMQMHSLKQNGILELVLADKVTVDDLDNLALSVKYYVNICRLILKNKLSYQDATTIPIDKAVFFEINYERVTNNILNDEIAFSEVISLTRVQFVLFFAFNKSIIALISEGILTFDKFKELSVAQLHLITENPILTYLHFNILSVDQAINLPEDQLINISNNYIQDLIVCKILNIDDALNLTEDQYNILINRGIHDLIVFGKLDITDAMDLTLRQIDLAMLNERDLLIKMIREPNSSYEAIIYTALVLAEAFYITDVIKAIKDMEFEMLHGEAAADERSITLSINTHFNNVIKPQYQTKLSTYGNTQEECINEVHKLIRKDILLQIKANLLHDLSIYEEKSNSNQVNKINNTIKFIDENIDLLIIAGQDILEKSRDHFTSNVDSAQIAWRGYDPGSPYIGEYPSYFSTPMNSNQITFTTREARGSSDAITNGEACEIVRERAAYYYLLINDSEDPVNGTIGFIDYLATIRRKCGRPEGDDQPSCFPGNLTRLALSVEKYPIAKLPKAPKEYINEFMQAHIIKTFGKEMRELPNDEARYNLYHSIIMLSEINADEIYIDPSEYSLNWIDLRRNFVASLGSITDLAGAINELMLKECGRELIADDIIYIDNHLFNPGGGSIAASLNNIFLTLRDNLPVHSDEKTSENQLDAQQYVDDLSHEGESKANMVKDMENSSHVSHVDENLPTHQSTIDDHEYSTSQSSLDQSIYDPNIQSISTTASHLYTENVSELERKLQAANAKLKQRQTPIFHHGNEVSTILSTNQDVRASSTSSSSKSHLDSFGLFRKLSVTIDDTLSVSDELENKASTSSTPNKGEIK